MPEEIVLVSAVQGDIAPGVEISDPACPVEWDRLPEAARRWALEQGYGKSDWDLLYVLAGPDEEPPAGMPSIRVEPVRRRLS